MRQEAVTALYVIVSFIHEIWQAACGGSGMSCAASPNSFSRHPMTARSIRQVVAKEGGGSGCKGLWKYESHRELERIMQVCRDVSNIP